MRSGRSCIITRSFRCLHRSQVRRGALIVAKYRTDNTHRSALCHCGTRCSRWTHSCPLPSAIHASHASSMQRVWKRGLSVSGSTILICASPFRQTGMSWHPCYTTRAYQASVEINLGGERRNCNQRGAADGQNGSDRLQHRESNIATAAHAKVAEQALGCTS